MEAPWHPTVLYMFEDVCLWHSIIKDPITDVLGRAGDQGSAIAALKLLADQRCALCRQGFYSSVCQPVALVTQVSVAKVYQQFWKGWAGWCT